jgi:PIN domain nuclease of toxin-antitoxin system
MKLLLDTHILLWWLADDAALSDHVLDAISNPDNVVSVSAVSLWEIAIKRRLGKLDMPDDWATHLAGEAFQQLPITWRHAQEVENLPTIHRDPFDRMLIAQSRVEKLTLVTDDKTIRQYDVTML